MIIKIKNKVLLFMMFIAICFGNYIYAKDLNYVAGFIGNTGKSGIRYQTFVKAASDSETRNYVSSLKDKWGSTKNYETHRLLFHKTPLNNYSNVSRSTPSVSSVYYDKSINNVLLSDSYIGGSYAKYCESVQLMRTCKNNG